MHTISSICTLSCVNIRYIFPVSRKKTGTSRINRIAKGGGVNNSEIHALLKQYKMLSEMIKDSSELQNIDPSKGISQKQIQKMMKKFGKKEFKI